MTIAVVNNHPNLVQCFLNNLTHFVIDKYDIAYRCLLLKSMTPPHREKKAYIRSLGEEEVDLSTILSPEEDNVTTNDMLLAQMLQYEFDREYDQQVKREEKQYNGNSKGTFAPYTLLGFPCSVSY